MNDFCLLTLTSSVLILTQFKVSNSGSGLLPGKLDALMIILADYLSAFDHPVLCILAGWKLI